MGILDERESKVNQKLKNWKRFIVLTVLIFFTIFGSSFLWGYSDGVHSESPYIDTLLTMRVEEYLLQNLPVPKQINISHEDLTRCERENNCTQAMLKPYDDLFNETMSNFDIQEAGTNLQVPCQTTITTIISRNTGFEVINPMDDFVGHFGANLINQHHVSIYRHADLLTSTINYWYIDNNSCVKLTVCIDILSTYVNVWFDLFLLLLTFVLSCMISFLIVLISEHIKPKAEEVRK
jgi:hypothetical protein